MSEFSAHLKELEEKMEKAVSSFKTELSGLRTGRASASLLAHIQVQAYGGGMPLEQVATVSVPEARLLSVQVWDRAVVAAVEKAIREAGLGINPVIDGQTLKLPIPEPNQERRQEYVKLAHKYAEQARISVRQVRRSGMDLAKKMEKDGLLSEDAQRETSTGIQKLTDRFVEEIDKALEKKEKDILTV